MNNKTNKNKGLGRGLSSLIADVSGLADTEMSSDSMWLIDQDIVVNQ